MLEYEYIFITVMIGFLAQFMRAKFVILSIVSVFGWLGYVFYTYEMFDGFIAVAEIYLGGTLALLITKNSKDENRANSEDWDPM